MFQKKTKAKLIDKNIGLINNLKITDYLITCFYYIHLNPLNAKLVTNLKDWPFSSWVDYAGLRNGSLCNKNRLFELTGLNEQDCLLQNPDINDEMINQMF